MCSVAPNSVGVSLQSISAMVTPFYRGLPCVSMYVVHTYCVWYLDLYRNVYIPAIDRSRSDRLTNNTCKHTYRGTAHKTQVRTLRAYVRAPHPLCSVGPTHASTLHIAGPRARTYVPMAHTHSGMPAHVPWYTHSGWAACMHFVRRSSPRYGTILLPLCTVRVRTACTQQLG